MTLTLLDRVRAVTGAPAPATAEADEPQTAAVEEEGTPAQADAVHAYLDKHEEKFRAALPACVSYDAFSAAVRGALPKLARCTPASLLQAFLTCARFGLIPDGYEAVVTAQGRTAVFIPTYKGYVALMYRSGQVKSVHVGVIHANDEWSIEPTAPAPLDFTHKPRPELSKAERGPVVLTYAFAWLEGGARSQVVYINREKAEELRDEYSVAYQEAEASGKRDSFWHVDFVGMWRKSAMRALFPLVPNSAEVQRLAAADDAADAGRVQILHAPDPEPVRLLAEADAAARAAEASQEVVRPGLERQRAQIRRRAARSRGKRQRGGPKAVR